ncbi:MAG: class I SAM-dependent methyltransferase [Thermoleophilia bacterium]|nr:class I SAM-dependent methyltransferase [Thermoleophilia bacterium]
MQDFDKYSETYQEELDRCLNVSGYSSDYFAEYKARYLERFLPDDFDGRILDYGCGIGLLTAQMARHLPRARLNGYDVSAVSIAKIGSEIAARGLFTQDFSMIGHDYDLIVMSSVLHHIPPGERSKTIEDLAERLSRKGQMVIFEHNPLNPVTRRIVDRCDFDRDARLLAASEAAGHLRQAGLNISRRDYMVFFPGRLRWFRPLERLLGWLPLGGQYAIAGQRDA